MYPKAKWWRKARPSAYRLHRSRPLRKEAGLAADKAIVAHSPCGKLGVRRAGNEHRRGSWHRAPLGGSGAEKGLEAKTAVRVKAAVLRCPCCGSTSLGAAAECGSDPDRNVGQDYATSMEGDSDSKSTSMVSVTRRTLKRWAPANRTGIPCSAPASS